MIYNKQTVGFDQYTEELHKEWVAEGGDKYHTYDKELLLSYYHQGMDIHEAIMEYKNDTK